MKYNKVYIDTNVIRGCVRRRPDFSPSLLKAIRQQNLQCITSIFTLLELWRIEKEEDFFFKMVHQGYDLNAILRQRGDLKLTDTELNEINSRLDKFFNEYDYIPPVQLIGEGWQFAVDIARTTNVQPADIIHLATALGEKCDLLVTNDSPFTTQAKKFLKRNSYTLEILDVECAEAALIGKEVKQK
jgi:predicted nucleic acid-binding protein